MVCRLYKVSTSAIRHETRKITYFAIYNFIILGRQNTKNITLLSSKTRITVTHDGLLNVEFTFNLIDYIKYILQIGPRNARHKNIVTGCSNH
jgi:hypothetical protein